MRIKQISVNSLFGVFNHTIDLNLEKRITIIHGPNGYGKTVILKLINAIFHNKYSEIFKIPFAELKIEFDDLSVLKIKKEKQIELPDQKDANEKKLRDIKLLLAYKKKNGRALTHSISSLTNQVQSRDFRSNLEKFLPFLTRISYDEWSDDRTGEVYFFDEVIDRFQIHLPLGQVNRESEPAWFSDLKKTVDVRFIETQRLFSFKRIRRTREFSDRPTEAVINYSKALVDRIQEILTVYATNSQSLDRTFPKRLLIGEESVGLTKEQLKTNLNELERKRSHLMELGLLDKQEEEMDFSELENKFTANNRNVLSVYIKDVKEKLSVFNELSDKIDILLFIIASKFQYKKMVIDKKEGFVFYTNDNEKLSPISLSSGEQHELILLNELLFNVKPDSLILIDEPELSLHIIWQQQFLTDLQKIIGLVNFDVIIATHAPEIIGNQWDLTVQLKGP